MIQIDATGKGLGYIKLFRQIMDSEVFEEGLFMVFCWCVMKANYKTKYVRYTQGRGSRMIHIQRGSFLYGRHSAAKELKMSPSTVRNRIAKLEGMNMIRVDKLGDKQPSILSVVNYNTYQSHEESKDKKEDKQRTSKGQAKDTTNKDKKEKKDNILEQVVKIYHGVLPELPKVVKLNPQRELAINWAIDNHPEAKDLQWWESYFKLARQYPMVMDPEGVFAPKKPNYRANFDWLLLGRNMTKVLEGGWAKYEVDAVDKSGSTDYSKYLKQKESK